MNETIGSAAGSSVSSSNQFVQGFVSFLESIPDKIYSWMDEPIVRVIVVILAIYGLYKLTLGRK